MGQTRVKRISANLFMYRVNIRDDWKVRKEKNEEVCGKKLTDVVGLCRSIGSI